MSPDCVLLQRISAGGAAQVGGADEMAQLALIKFFRVLRRGEVWFTNFGAIQRYLHQVGRNCVNTELRRCLSSHPGEVTLDVAVHDRPVAWSDPAQRAEFADWCRMTAAGLPLRYAGLFMALQEGYSVMQFAARCGISVRTAERMRRGLRRILIDPYGLFRVTPDHFGERERERERESNG